MHLLLFDGAQGLSALDCLTARAAGMEESDTVDELAWMLVLGYRSMGGELQQLGHVR